MSKHIDCMRRLFEVSWSIAIHRVRRSKRKSKRERGGERRERERERESMRDEEHGSVLHLCITPRSDPPLFTVTEIDTTISATPHAEETAGDLILFLGNRWPDAATPPKS